MCNGDACLNSGDNASFAGETTKKVNGFLNRTNVAEYLQRGYPYSTPHLVVKYS